MSFEMSLSSLSCTIFKNIQFNNLKYVSIINGAHQFRFQFMDLQLG